MGSAFLVRFPKKFGEHINIALSYLVVASLGLIVGFLIAYNGSKSVRLHREIRERAEEIYQENIERHLQATKEFGDGVAHN